MNPTLRRSLCAFGWLAVVALALGAAASSALSLREAQAEVASLRDTRDALAARERRALPAPGGGAEASPLFAAKTITQAGAALQQRLEAAVASAHGRLVSSKVELGRRGDERRIAIAAELTIAEPDMQALLFDLETGRPYLFVEAFEARASGDGAMRVALDLSGQWSLRK